MAEPNTISWHLLKIELGQGDGPPETFAAPCALRTKEVQFQSQTSEVYLIDCTTPEGASWATRNVIGQSATITGSGTLDMDDWDTWRGWYEGATRKNVRINFDVASDSNGGYYEGPCILTSLTFTGSRDDEGGLVSIQLEIQSAGALTWTGAT